MAHAAESTHFYRRDGTPAYTVEAKAGHQRPATVRDARKLGLVPSVTSIIRCAAAPGLERWKQDQVLHAALTLPRMPDEAEAQWIERVWVDSKETARKAAERGTAIHAAIQGAYDGEAYPSETFQYIAGAMKAVDQWQTERFPAADFWKPEASFAHPIGFGGKVDLSCKSAVLDFKTKEFGPDADLKTWDEHAMQLAAYRQGLGMPNARAAIVYVSVTQPGLSRLIEIPEEDLARGWECFKALLAFWQHKNKYHSGFANAERESALA